MRSQHIRILPSIQSRIRMLSQPSPPAVRAVLALAAGAAVFWSVWPSWDVVVAGRDSQSYVRNSAFRTPLYPWWIDLFEPRSDVDPGEGRQEDPRHPLIGVARGQKVLYAVAVAVLLWSLSARWNAWLLAGALGGFAWWSARKKLAAQGLLHTSYLDSILSEGINGALLLLWLAAVFAYLGRPTRGRGAIVAGLLFLLVFNRPANAPLAVVLPWLWVFHRFTDGRRQAWRRAGLIAATFTLLVWGWCAWNLAVWGRFKQHPATGFNAIGIALQLGRTDDLPHFPDPLHREFLRRCLVDHADRRLPTADRHYFNRNVWRIAVPVLRELYGQSHSGNPPDEFYWEADSLLTSVSLRLIRRHPREYAAIVWGNARDVWQAKRHLPLLAAAVAAAVLFFRRRTPDDLFVLMVATLPAALLVPACLIELPIERYQSQAYFAELLALPLLGIAHVSACAQGAKAAEAGGARRRV